MPAGMIASGDAAAREPVDRPLHHAVAAPDEHELGAFVECPLDALGGVLALRHLRPDRLVDPLLREDRAQLLEPAADRLAGVGDHRNLLHAFPSVVSAVMDASAASRCAAAAPAARAAKIVMQRAAMPIRTPAATSVMWCMPRNIRDQATNTGIATTSDQRMIRIARVLDPRGEDDQQAAEQGDRGCRVPRGVAGVDRQALEPLHVGPVAMDDEARSPVGARLDADHEQRERGEPPVLRHEEHDEQDPDEGRDHEPAREGRADPREIDRGARPLPDDGAADALVPGGDAVDLQDHPGQEEADGDRQRKQDRVAAEDGCEEDANGMARADRGGEPLCRPAGRRLEERRPRAVAAILDRASGRGLRLGRGLISRWATSTAMPPFTRRWPLGKRPSAAMPFIVLLLLALTAGVTVYLLARRYPTAAGATPPATAAAGEQLAQGGSAAPVVRAPAPRPPRSGDGDRARAHARARDHRDRRRRHRSARLPRALERLPHQARRERRRLGQRPRRSVVDAAAPVRHRSREHAGDRSRARSSSSSSR